MLQILFFDNVSVNDSNRIADTRILNFLRHKSSLAFHLGNHAGKHRLKVYFNKHTGFNIVTIMHRVTFDETGRRRDIKQPLRNHVILHIFIVACLIGYKNLIFTIVV